jgi:TonB-linked SusC/RagA family outer membrane protein
MELTCLSARPAASDKNLLWGCFPVQSPSVLKMLRIMKLAVLFWLTALMQVSANGLSQNVSLSLRSASLKTALKEIEKQTRFSFTYTDDQLEKTVPVNLQVSNLPLQTVLNQIFRDQPLSWTIRNKTIVLADKPVVPLKDRLLIAPNPNYTRISGSITASDNKPLAGATIFIRRTSQTTTTDSAGRFTINAEVNDVLVISFVGYETREVTITAANINDAHHYRLNEKVSDLKEVEIVVAYGKQTRASYTGSAAVVSGKDLEGKPRASFQESLQGNVAGLQSTTGTGQPGASGNVRIRGIGSYSASSSPLYVVDGVPFVDGPTTVLAFSSNTLAGINPNDIESVTVLKDASATSIYGSRGANGVILITTKSGAAGKTKVQMGVQTGFSQIAMSDRNKPLNTREMTELLIEGVLNNNTTLAGITTNQAAYQYLVDQGLKPNVNTDWADVILRRGKFSQYDISASGGNDKTTFFTSAGYYKQDATVRDQGFERANVRLRLKHKASNRLSINVGMAPNFQKLSTIGNAGLGANPIRSLNRLVPWVAPYNADGSYTAITYNPEIVRKENRYDTRIYAFLGDIGAEFRILPGLSAESKMAIDMSFTDDYRFWSPLWVDAASVKGRAAEYTSLLINWNITNLLRYNTQLGDFSLNATLGQEAQKFTSKYISTQADGFAQSDLYTLASAATPFVAWSSQAASSLVSYFLNTSINYQRKYYLNLTGRIDGSSRFGRNVRYAKFGSIGLAWNLDQEDIIRDLGFIDMLKIRASYGTSGNQASDLYGVLGVYSTASSYNNSPAYSISQIENANLTWEKNNPFDIGFEFGVLDNRLTGSFDYYRRITSDLLMDAPISAVNGAGTAATQNRNIGSFENSGIEVSLSSENIRAAGKNDLSWKTSFNISTNKNRMLTLSGSNQIISGVFNREIGGDYYEYYLPGWAGVNEQTGEGLWWVDGTKKATTTKFTEAAAFNQGSATPRFFGGLTNTFEYRNFSLSFMFYFNYGNKLYDSWGAFTSNDASSGVTDYGVIARVDYDNRWQKPGDKASSPKMVYRGTQTGLSGQNSSRFMYDGSYIRLRDVSLTYDVPVKNTVFQKLQVYLRGNNLLTMVKDDRLRHDPETYIGGILNQNLPIARQFLAGLNITF